MDVNLFVIDNMRMPKNNVLADWREILRCLVRAADKTTSDRHAPVSAWGHIIVDWQNPGGTDQFARRTISAGRSVYATWSETVTPFADVLMKPETCPPEPKYPLVQHHFACLFAISERGLGFYSL